MITEFKLPLISPHMAEALIECFHAQPCSALKPGDKLLDLSVHLGANFAQDCPPISFYRVVIREKIILRQYRVAQGQTCKVGDVIAVFSTSPDESLDDPPQREVRIATAGIIHHAGMRTWNA
jgi:pyruvate/2-oxoglutarate dehydrogenase complex dihydrolipoamide acyltransferase (E2) component